MQAKAEKKAKRRPIAAGNDITDARFAAAQTDPRFHRFPKAKNKVEIDERFAGMFKDKAFQVRSTVDKRGRKLQNKKAKEDMRKYYRLQNEEEDWIDEEADKSDAKEQPDTKGEGSRKTHAKKPQKPVDPTPESSSSEEDEDARREEVWARARGLAGPTSSSDEEESSSGSSDFEAEDGDGNEEEIDLEEWGVGVWAANPDEQVPEIPEATNRLAIVDLDWTKVKAVDIFVMLQSFLKKGQKVEKVTVYPSDYGLERMADEARFGPRGLTSSNQLPNVATHNPEDESEGELEDSEDEWSGDDAQDKAHPLKASKTGKKIQGRDHGRQNGAAGGNKQKGSRKGDQYKMSAAERKEVLELLNEQESESDEEVSSHDDDELAGELNDRVSSDEEYSSSNSQDDDADLTDQKSYQKRKAGPRDLVPAKNKPDEKARRLLQLYEQSRLRYYYAIVDCADVETASQLYNECNDMEFEHSANLFDLRFVLDEQEFKGRQIRDSASEVPAGYKPPDVGAASMLHTNPKLSWDADDDSRKKALLQRVSKEKLRDDDFKAYLGSESDEEEPSKEQLTGAEKYKMLLSGGPTAKAGSKDWKTQAQDDSDEEERTDEERDETEQDPTMEMQVTFGGGLDLLSHKLRLKQEEKANKKADTVWESYMRRRREKKQQSKRKRGGSSDDDAYSEPDSPDGTEAAGKREDNAFDDPFFQDDGGGVAEESDADEKPAKKSKRADKDASTRKAGKKAELEAEKRRKAELEMLLLDEAALINAGPGKQRQDEAEASLPKSKLSRKARIAAKRAEKRAKRQNDSDQDDTAPQPGISSLDTGDKRFAALFDNADFALDPTDPRFSSNQGFSKILKESAIRRSKAPKKIPQAAEDASVPKVQGKEDKAASLQHLVASLKRKGGGSGKLKHNKDKQAKAGSRRAN